MCNKHYKKTPLVSIGFSASNSENYAVYWERKYSYPHLYNKFRWKKFPNNTFLSEFRYKGGPRSQLGMFGLDFKCRRCYSQKFTWNR